MEARMAAVNAPDYTPKPNRANQDLEFSILAARGGKGVASRIGDSS